MTESVRRFSHQTYSDKEACVSRSRKAIVTVLTAAWVLGSVAAANANPVERLCDGPRDGKAVWYHLICE